MMTGRKKLLAAFLPGGAPEIGVVACYEGLFIRDHYDALTRAPWWDPLKRDVLAKDFHHTTGLEWFSLVACPSRHERAHQSYVPCAEGVRVVDSETGEETWIPKPVPGGAKASRSQPRQAAAKLPPATREEVDARIPLAPEFDRRRFLAEGRHDGAAAVRRNTDLFLYRLISSPLWSLYGLCGYEGLMLWIAQDPALVEYAGRRAAANAIQTIRMIAALGADAVWIEECFTDQVSPAFFERVNVPLLQHCVQAIRACGMKSIYYYCGNPNDRIEAIMNAGADAVHFEESKKGFRIDIAEIVARVNRRCVVFGNVDAIGILQNGSEEDLRAEIARQMDAGRRNGNRFILSTGSPITPATPVERIRLFTNCAWEWNAQHVYAPA